MKNFDNVTMSEMYTNAMWSDTKFQEITQHIRNFITESVKDGQREANIAFDTEEEYSYWDVVVDWLSSEGFYVEEAEDSEDGVYLIVSGWSMLPSHTIEMLNEVNDCVENCYGTNEEGDEIYG